MTDMVTLTRLQVASATGLTALFVLASVGAALPSAPMGSPSDLKLPASGAVLAQSSHNSGIQLMAKAVKRPKKRAA
jgi:hypothetical protein